MITRYKAWIAAKDYETFKRLMPRDPDLPHTYDEWLYLADKEIAEIQSVGHVAKKVEINPNEFSAYCRSTGIECNSTLLHAFAFAKATRDKN